MAAPSKKLPEGRQKCLGRRSAGLPFDHASAAKNFGFVGLSFVAAAVEEACMVVYGSLLFITALRTQPRVKSVVWGTPMFALVVVDRLADRFRPRIEVWF